MGLIAVRNKVRTAKGLLSVRRRLSILSAHTPAVDLLYKHEIRRFQHRHLNLGHSSSFHGEVVWPSLLAVQE
jgi:hypothetical protein